MNELIKIIEKTVEKLEHSKWLNFTNKEQKQETIVKLSNVVFQECIRNTIRGVTEPKTNEQGLIELNRGQ